jgi:LysR family transcriptional regulator, nod-box dependent transcriptional activator
MRYRKLDLNLLVALDALLHESNVTKAADRVFLTQPAMSNALARLRRHFQDELITQVGRRMMLTEKGQSMKDEIRAILLRVDAVTQPADAFDPRTVRREFRVSASDYFCSLWVPAIVQYLAQHAPGISVDVLPLGPRLNEELERGEIDLLIVPSVYAVKGYPMYKLFEDDWVCLAWAQSTAPGRRLTMRRFLELEHVVKRQNHPSFPPLEASALAKSGITRQIAVRVPQYGLLPLALVGTDRIATVQRRLAELACTWLPLKMYRFPLECSRVEETMQWHPARDADSGHQWLRQAVITACR